MEIIESISESGILIVIAGVFLYTYISDKKENKEVETKQQEQIKAEHIITNTQAQVVVTNLIITYSPI